ncbi:class IV adenylate cyclase [Nostoc sp. CHAB 5844]|nr:class IV adenylate cyclase [Nostoc sp. CHAB 5844]
MRSAQSYRPTNAYRSIVQRSCLPCCLARLGVIGTVEKRRRVYIVDRTRVHLDRVESLGDFMELEVVLKDGEAVEAGVDVANSLMKTLDIRQENLVSCAYIDLLQALD